MSYQQQGFADPATSAQEQRPINTDPREQPQWPVGQPPSTPYPPRQGSRPWKWLGISVVILVVIFGGLFTASALLTSTTTETNTFAVSGTPTIVVNNGNGSVHLVNGPAGLVSVVAHKHVWLGNSNQLPIRYDLSADHQTLTITVDGKPEFNFFGGNQGVDFDLTVPGQSDLQVQTSNGSITATGISGQINLASSNGSIDARQIAASGTSTFKTSNGSVTFVGSLDPNNGTYLFSTSNGSIDVTLPANASLNIMYDLSNGSFGTDFPMTGDGTVGSAPYAQVTLHTSNGSIHLHKGS